MKTIILASLAAVALATASSDPGRIRSRLEASFGWDHQQLLMLNFHVVVDVRA